MSADGQFFLSITGSIEHAEFYDVNNAYCKYGFHFGPEWSVVAGVEEGLTQMCKCSSDPRNLAVWNFPLEITFKSTNPYGWPQLIMSIYGLDIFGHDVIRGYGVCHLPLKTGHHEKRVSVYVPESSSALQRFAAWLTGRRPELIDPAILASGGGRERKAIFGTTLYSHAYESRGYCYRNVQRRAQRFLQVGLRQWREAQEIIRFSGDWDTYRSPSQWILFPARTECPEMCKKYLIVETEHEMIIRLAEPEAVTIGRDLKRALKRFYF